jgi:uncharacterized protein (DUF2141 family)
MRKYRLFTAVLALGAAAGLAAAAAPAASAAPVTARHASARQGVVPAFNFSCPNAWTTPSPFTKVVNATGIHIRNNPQGSVLYSIAKGAHFESLWFDSNGFQVGCESPIEGPGPSPAQHWILGWDTGNNKHIGWVGLKYLNSE